MRCYEIELYLYTNTPPQRTRGSVRGHVSGNIGGPLARAFGWEGSGIEGWGLGRVKGRIFGWRRGGASV